MKLDGAFHWVSRLILFLSQFVTRKVKFLTAEVF